jgi:hypothetical protein
VLRSAVGKGGVLHNNGAARRASNCAFEPRKNKENTLNLRRISVGAGVAIAVSIFGAAPAFAHDCFNPNKTVGAGSKGVVTLDAAGGETFTPAGNGKGNGGFITIDANAVAPGVMIDVMTFGGNKGPGQDGVAGPGAEKAGAKACDGKGIDYVEACFGAEPGE